MINVGAKPQREQIVLYELVIFCTKHGYPIIYKEMNNAEKLWNGNFILFFFWIYVGVNCNIQFFFKLKLIVSWAIETYTFKFMVINI